MTSATARLNLRLNWADKDRISRAAVLRGMSVSPLVRDVMMCEADQVMAAERAVTCRRQSPAAYVVHFMHLSEPTRS